MWAHDHLDAYGVGGYKTNTYSARVVKCSFEKARYVKAMTCWDCFARFMVAWITLKKKLKKNPYNVIRLKKSKKRGYIKFF